MKWWLNQVTFYGCIRGPKYYSVLKLEKVSKLWNFGQSKFSHMTTSELMKTRTSSRVDPERIFILLSQVTGWSLNHRPFSQLTFGSTNFTININNVSCLSQSAWTPGPWTWSSSGKLRLLHFIMCSSSCLMFTCVQWKCLFSRSYFTVGYKKKQMKGISFQYSRVHRMCVCQ